MGLRWKGVSANQLADILANAGREGREAGFRAMREEIETIKDISVEQVPVDTGELEAAHKVIVSRNQTNKAHYIVAVEGVFNGVDVDEYVGEIHYGNYNLGRLSEDKQDRVGRIVGPEFLSRAFDERMEALMEAVEEAVWREVNNNVR